ncbi:MAG TPA: molybdopterin cofactor-binding domain-containing protein [Thermoanaerobaculia bacterium]|nr:molybdopterin cofactor-binding domain-containing protein [Thermoanaerobaculia bacterium]
MSTSRRDFLRLGTLGGTAALVLQVRWEAGGEIVKTTAAAAAFSPSPWISIDASGKVTLTAHRSEMGQGARTSLPMILAEELGADWSRIEIRHASPGPDFPEMRTSGSSSVVESWDPLRQAGAAAREMLRAAAAARWGVPAASCRVENGQVVRDGGHSLPFGDLVAAASALPVPKNPPLKDPRDYTLVGTRVLRIDGPQIVRGTAAYGLDVQLPGLRKAAVARCPVFGGKALRWNAAAAKAIAGVREVVEIPTGIAVVADDTWTALKGRDALQVEWDEGPRASDATGTYWGRLEAALRAGGKTTRSEGDAAAALAGAARQLRAEYRYPFQAHATLEPMNCAAQVRPDGCEIWVGTQAPNEAQRDVAKLLGMKPEAVRLHVALLGGGFGRRLGYDYVIEAVELARRVPFPVQVVWTRPDDMQHDFFQPAALHELNAGLDAAGKPVAWIHRCATFHLSMFGPFSADDPEAYDGSPWGGYDTPYSVPALRVDYAPVEAPVPTGAWRSVGYPSTVFARESFVDEIAHATGRDPLMLRLELIPSPGRVKLRTVTLDNGDRLRRVLRLAAEKAGWGSPLPRPSDGRRWGRGLACNAYHRQTMVAQVAEVSVGLEGDVRVHRVVCAVDCGRAVNLAGLEGQVESGILWGLSATLHGRITFAHGRVEQRTYDDFPVMRMRDTPQIETHVVPSLLPPLGVGEQPVPPIYAAVANAIFAATGKRLRELPIRPPPSATR